MQERYDTFAEIADAAFGSILDFVESDKAKEVRKYLPRGQFVREYATLRLNLGRQTGKTEWIVDNAARSDIIIVATQMQVEELTSRFKAKDLPVPYILKAESVEYRFRGQRDLDKIGETIFVDDASYLDQAKLNAAINEIAIHIKPDHIVFLG